MSGRVELHLWLLVRGVNVSPEAISEATGITPWRAFHVGEGRGYSKSRAGWWWRRDGWTDVDTGPLFAEALAVLGPHEAVFAANTAAGAEIGLSLGGYYYGGWLATAEESDRAGFYVPENEPFEPFFECDTIGVDLEPDVIGFLHRIGATFTTHINALLDDRVAESDT